MRLRDRTYWTHHTRYDFSGRMIGPKQRPLPDNTHKGQTSLLLRESKQSRQAISRRPTSYTARPLGSARLRNTRENVVYVRHAAVKCTSYKEIIRNDLSAHYWQRNEHAVVFFSRINCYSECEVTSTRLKYSIQSKDLREINAECSFSIKIFWIFLPLYFVQLHRKSTDRIFRRDISVVFNSQ
jgi:hypothetical protein